MIKFKDMKYLVLALLFLISCAPIAQEATTKPTVETQPTAQPAPKTAEPPLESQIKVPQETVIEEPQVKEEPKPQLSPKEQCTKACDENCDSTAQNACTQKGRPDCKAMCGDNPTIDPSACTQACTYVPAQSNACKSMMSDFCSNQCVKTCH